MRRDGRVFAGLAVLGLFVAASAAGADDPATAARERVGHFKQIGMAARDIQLEVGKPSPDMAKVRDAAKRLEGLADQIPSWFPPGSGPETGLKMQARAEIWSDPVGFRAKAAALRASAEALEALPPTADQAALKSGFMNLAQACQACHTAFRTGEH